MATLYDGLLAFKGIYDNAIARQSVRDSAKIKGDWQTINNEMDCYYVAMSTGNTVTADTHITNIERILSSYDVVVDYSNPYPFPVSVDLFPSTVLIPCDGDGSNPSFTNTISIITVREPYLDVTNTWTFSIVGVSGVTATILSNVVSVTGITADTGYVNILGTKSGYDSMDVRLYVQKQRAGTSQLDGNSVDDVTLGFDEANVNAFIKRDSGSQDAIFGLNPDMVSVANLSLSEAPDPSKYIFKSSVLRKAPTRNNNYGVTSLIDTSNIETVGSISTFGQGNTLFGKDNKLDITSLTDSKTVFDETPNVDGTVGTIVFQSSQGNLTSFFTVGNKVLLYGESKIKDPDYVHYYITGTILTSVHTTITVVTFTADFPFTAALDTYFHNMHKIGRAHV